MIFYSQKISVTTNKARKRILQIIWFKKRTKVLGIRQQHEARNDVACWTGEASACSRQPNSKWKLIIMNLKRGEEDACCSKLNQNKAAKTKDISYHLLQLVAQLATESDSKLPSPWYYEQPTRLTTSIHLSYIDVLRRGNHLHWLDPETWGQWLKQSLDLSVESSMD